MEDEHPPSRTSRRKDVALEAFEAVARVAIATVPVVGSALAQAHSELVLAAQRRRWEDFYVDLAGRLAGEQLDELARDERFVTAVARASIAAARTHVVETRLALLNAVENTLSTTLDDDVIHMFITEIESLTPSHLRVLRLLADRTGEGMNRTDLIAHIDSTYPELAERGVLDRVLVDLKLAGLIIADAAPLLESSVLTFGADRLPDGRLITTLGDEFLAFISRKEDPT